MQNIEKDHLHLNSFWGKLTSLHHDFDNLSLDKNPFPLPILQNLNSESKSFKEDFDLECTICKDDSGHYWIQNDGVSNVSVENEILFKGKQKQLHSGDKISFKNPSSGTIIPFVFSADENSVKAETKRQIPFYSEEKIMLENDVKTELTCPLCMKYFYQCVNLVPCLHSFCATCILILFTQSQTCPCCETTFVEVRRNTAFNNLVEALAEIQDPQRSKEEFEELDSLYQNKVFVKHFEYANGDAYQGYFKKFKREGKGKLIYANGERYQGDFLNNLRHGKGRTIFSNGEKYEGSYEKNVRQGYGKYFYKCGDIYEGNFSSNLPNGKGKYTCVNGIKYVFEGEFKNGLREGKGTMMSEDGGCFEGIFKNDLKEGIGKNKYPSGDIYQGNYHNDMRDGKGIMQYFRGDIFEGDFKNDFRDGFGKYLFTNGDVLQGIFENGKFIGEGRMIYKNGDIYEGSFSEFLEPEGRGKFQYADGSIYEGRLIKGKREGRGVFISPQGKVSEGIFENDKPLLSSAKSLHR